MKTALSATQLGQGVKSGSVVAPCGKYNGDMWPAQSNLLRKHLSRHTRKTKVRYQDVYRLAVFKHLQGCLGLFCLSDAVSKFLDHIHRRHSDQDIVFDKENSLRHCFRWQDWLFFRADRCKACSLATTIENMADLSRQRLVRGVASRLLSSSSVAIAPAYPVTSRTNRRQQSIWPARRRGPGSGTLHPSFLFSSPFSFRRTFVDHSSKSEHRIASPVRAKAGIDVIATPHGCRPSHIR